MHDYDASPFANSFEWTRISSLAEWSAQFSFAVPVPISQRLLSFKNKKRRVYWNTPAPSPASRKNTFGLNLSK